MNHDETNSNPEMKAWLEPELEARVIAWVLGEASAFEAAELERLCVEKPELAIFKRRIEAVHGLVGEAVRPEKEALRMSAERREKLLATLGAGAKPTEATGNPPEKKAAVFAAPRPRHSAWRKQVWLVGSAACAALGAFVVIKLSPDKTQEARVTELAIPQFRVEAPAAPKMEAEARRDVLARKERAGDEAGGRGAETKAKGSRVDAGLDQFRGLTDGAAAASSSTPELDSVQPVVNSTASARVGGAAGQAREFPPPVIAADDDPTVVRQTGTMLSGTRMNSALPSVPAGDLNASVDLAEARSRETLAAAKSLRKASVEAHNARSGGRAENGPLPASAVGGQVNAPFAVSSDLSSPVNLSASPKSEAVAWGAPPPVPAAPIAVADADKIVLSPFEVSASKDRGYAAAATVSGGRLNTPLREVGSATKVVTQQQLHDTASVSIDEEQSAKKAAEKQDVMDDQARRPVPTTPSPPPSTAETSTAREAVSTFSLHVSDVSFRLAQAALARGELPEAARIRPEEFYNAFDYGDPSATVAEKVGARIEQAAHPFVQQRNLLRIALKVPATGRGAGQPLRLTVLLDTSGSMEREDRATTVRAALRELVALLGPEDRITVIGFARQPRLLAEAVAGNQAGWLVDLIARTPSEGGTNLEEALKLAGALAERHRHQQGQNRIVLLTDGAANLGNADPAKLATAIDTLRQKGFAFDACGVGREIDDGLLEPLTRRGDGRYYVLASPADADAGFARQLAGAFRPAAENVKLQVRFNPARVGRYRLIGFEQHRLREEDFRNDAVDAAELAAEEGAVALYQVEVLPQGEGEVGEVFVRFRDPATAAMVERSWTITHEPWARAFDRATPTLQLAGTAALLAEKLRGGDFAAQFKLGDFAGVVNALRGHYTHERRVQEFVTMFGQARRRAGE